ncbi:MAG: hypothetical protein FWG68_10950 [Defluviitaleaceae bacterium]|nr:hypothetical protein [Defluviitaleaceae bacterium]
MKKVKKLAKCLVAFFVLLCVVMVHTAVVFAVEIEDYEPYSREPETWARIVDELVGRATGLNTRNAHFIILHCAADSTRWNDVDGAFREFYQFLVDQRFFHSGDRISYVPFARHVAHNMRETFNFNPDRHFWVTTGSLMLGGQTRQPPGSDMEEPLQVVLEELYASDQKDDELIIILRFANMITGDRLDHTFDGGEPHFFRPYLDAPWGIRESDLAENIYQLDETGRYRLSDRWRLADGTFRLDDTFIRSEDGIHWRTGNSSPYIIDRAERERHLLNWFNPDGGVIATTIDTGVINPGTRPTAFYLTMWFPDNISNFPHPETPINRTALITDLVPTTHSRFSHRVNPATASIDFILESEDEMHGMALYISTNESSLRDVLSIHSALTPAQIAAQNVIKIEVLRTELLNAEIEQTTDDPFSMMYHLSINELINSLGEQITEYPFYFSINPILNDGESISQGLVHDIPPITMLDIPQEQIAPLALTLSPLLLAVDDNNLTAVSVVGGTAAGVISLDTGNLPLGVTATVNATGEIIVTGVRPEEGQPPITGTYSILVTRQETTETLNVTANLTAIIPETAPVNIMLILAIVAGVLVLLAIVAAIILISKMRIKRPFTLALAMYNNNSGATNWEKEHRIPTLASKKNFAKPLVPLVNIIDNFDMFPDAPPDAMIPFIKSVTLIGNPSSKNFWIKSNRKNQKTQIFNGNNTVRFRFTDQINKETSYSITFSRTLV